MSYRNEILNVDYREGFDLLGDESIDQIITSPPYWQARAYGMEDGVGFEASPKQYVENLRPLFRQAMRVLKPYGGFWFNIGDARSQGKTRQRGRRDTDDERGGDTFNGWSTWDGDTAVVDVSHDIPPKSFIGIPEMFMFMALEEGFIIRDKIIWAKGVAYYDGRSYGGTTPSPARDRFATAWEHVYYLTKNRYNYFNYDEIKFEAKSRDGYKMPTNVLVVPPAAGRPRRKGQSNFATYPPALIDILVKAGCPLLVCGECGVPANMKPDYSNADKCVHTENNWASQWAKGIVLDPFMGSGTTAISAINSDRDFLGFEINDEYIEYAEEWIKDERNGN